MAAVCRGGRRDVEQAVASVRDSRPARVMVVVHASEATAKAAHRTAAEALAAGIDPVRHARGPGDTIAVDVCACRTGRAVSDDAAFADYLDRLTHLTGRNPS
ncbi:hypothetical protein [Streptomyces sp. SCL15-4]|uniref:hypothetical protein n=1 Tax=Streptomyces sp. SCL15-4 TaxID=2967221 RepID=UPI00296766C4|nr:hypothetical protein [Streptomyces sp. SCL15-4]